MVKAHFKNIKTEIVTAISSANTSLKIAVAWFTNNEIFEALLDKCREGKLDIQLIIIYDSINIKHFGLDFNEFIRAGGKMYFGDSSSLMHHKFCIVDNSILLNGSYNWTFWAETKNKENITVITDESDVIENFNNEFESLLSDKQPIQSVNPDDITNMDNDEQLLNYEAIRVDEYISSAIYLGQTGRENLAADIFQRVNSLNPAKTNKVLQSGLNSGLQFYDSIYNAITVRSRNHSTDKTYEAYCQEIKNLFGSGNYVAAIATANICADKFPNRFSVHVYCGDSKMKLNDIEGARAEYAKALSYKHQKGSKILYYGKIYNYPYFPYADIYLKLGERDMLVQTLKDAVTGYRNLNIQTSVSKAELYLKKLENNEKFTRIE
jgi:hypothetical protein